MLALSVNYLADVSQLVLYTQQLPLQQVNLRAHHKFNKDSRYCF